MNGRGGTQGTRSKPNISNKRRGVPQRRGLLLCESLGDSEGIFPARGGGGSIWGRRGLKGDVVYAKVHGSLLGQSPGTFLEVHSRLH